MINPISINFVDRSQATYEPFSFQYAISSILVLLFSFQDVRKKGSASKLIFINNNLDDR
jgi:hypothetical protein